MSGGGQRRLERQRGSALLELPFVLGLIVLPFALLVLQVPIWVRHQAAANDAAGELARAAVVIEGRPSATAEPADLLAAIEASHGLRPGALHAIGSVAAGPGAPVTVTVAVDIPAISLPVFGVIGRRSWTTSHTERQPDFGSVGP